MAFLGFVGSPARAKGAPPFMALISQANPGMNTKTQPGRFVVLAALDGATSDDVALVAARFASGVAGGELHLVHVIGIPPARGANATHLLADGRARLERAGSFAEEIHKGKLLGHLAAGDPCHEILQMAARLKADLVIVGTHDRKGIDRLLMGSVAEHVVRRASCPVLVVRDKDYQDGLAPEIEPPCPECVEVQIASKGDKMWCARHSQHHPHGHTFSEIPPPFALGSSIIRP
jgi:nucleotide-binding universal stress UspA family protein